MLLPDRGASSVRRAFRARALEISVSVYQRTAQGYKPGGCARNVATVAAALLASHS